MKNYKNLLCVRKLHNQTLYYVSVLTGSSLSLAFSKSFILANSSEPPSGSCLSSLQKNMLNMYSSINIKPQLTFRNLPLLQTFQVASGLTFRVN